MTVRLTATRSTRIGAVLAVAAAALVSTATGSSAAPVTITASPATGSASTVITLATTTANTFRTAGGASRTGAVQFQTAACPTVAAGRTITDGVISGTTTLTSTAAAFASGDVGRVVSGTGIPAGTTITAVSGSTATLSAASTNGAVASITITPNPVPQPRSVSDATASNGGTTLTSTAAAFSANDVGKVVSGNANLAAGTVITAVSGNVATLSLPTTGAITAGSATFTPAAASTVTAVSGLKLVIKPPANLPAAAYKVCVYDNTLLNVLATSAFQVYAAPTVTAISSTSGPAIGGNSITVDGTGFTAATKATLGGVALTSLQVKSATQFVAVVPAHAPAAAQTVVVTTEGGSSAGFGSYTFLDGIVVAPQSVVTGQSAVLDVMGAGFSALTFDPAGTPTDGTAHVFIKKGGQGATWTSGGDDGECTSVVVVSDGELICTLDSANAAGSKGAAAVPDAAYQVLVVDKGDGTGSRLTKVSSQSTLTVAPF